MADTQLVAADGLALGRARRQGLAGLHHDGRHAVGIEDGRVVMPVERPAGRRADGHQHGHAAGCRAVHEARVVADIGAADAEQGRRGAVGAEARRVPHGTCWQGRHQLFAIRSIGGAAQHEPAQARAARLGLQAAQKFYVVLHGPVTALVSAAQHNGDPGTVCTAPCQLRLGLRPLLRRVPDLRLRRLGLRARRSLREGQVVPKRVRLPQLIGHAPGEQRLQGGIGEHARPAEIVIVPAITHALPRAAEIAQQRRAAVVGEVDAEVVVLRQEFPGKVDVPAQQGQRIAPVAGPRVHEELVDVGAGHGQRLAARVDDERDICLGPGQADMAQGRREIHEIPHARIVQEQDALWRAAHGLAIARRRKGRLQFLHQCRHVEVAALGDMLIRLFHGRLQRILRTVLQLGLTFVIAMAQPCHEPGRFLRRQLTVRHTLLQGLKEIVPRRLGHRIESPLPQHLQKPFKLRGLYLMQARRMLCEIRHLCQLCPDAPGQQWQLLHHDDRIVERFMLPQDGGAGNAVSIVEKRRANVARGLKQAGDHEQAVLVVGRGLEAKPLLLQETAAEKLIPYGRDGAQAVEFQPCGYRRFQQIWLLGGMRHIVFLLQLCLAIPHEIAAQRVHDVGLSLLRQRVHLRIAIGEQVIVAVHKGHVAAARQFQAPVAGRTGTGIGLPHEPEAGLRPVALLTEFCTAVRRAVVNADDFQFPQRLPENAVDTARDIVAPVVHRHNDRKLRFLHNFCSFTPCH